MVSIIIRCRNAGPANLHSEARTSFVLEPFKNLEIIYKEKQMYTKTEIKEIEVLKITHERQLATNE